MKSNRIFQLLDSCWLDPGEWTNFWNTYIDLARRGPGTMECISLDLIAGHKLPRIVEMQAMA